MYPEISMVYSKVNQVLVNFVELKKSLTFFSEHVYRLTKVSIDSRETFALIPFCKEMEIAKQPFLLNQRARGRIHENE